MTDLLVRPASRRAVGESEPDRSPSLVLVGAGAAAAAVAAGLLALLVLILVLWALEPQDGGRSVGAPVRAAADLWLLANGAGLRVLHGTGSPSSAGLLPLGLTLAVAGMLSRAARRTSERVAAGVQPPQVLAVVGVVALPYALLAGLLAAVSGTGSVSVSPWRAVLGAGALALVFGLVGASRWRPWRDAPRRVAAAVRGGVAALLALLAGGALLGGASLAVHAGAASSIAGRTASGAVGATGLLLVSVCLLPNAVVWGASYALGTGFSIGAGTSVSPFVTHVGITPAVPLLAGLPTGHPPGWAPVVLLLPVLSGVLGVLVAVRWMEDGTAARTGWLGITGLGCASATIAGTGVALLAVLSGGPVTAGRLTTVGPSAWQAGLAATGLVGLGALASGGLLVAHRRRAARQADAPRLASAADAAARASESTGIVTGS